MTSLVRPTAVVPTVTTRRRVRGSRRAVAIVTPLLVLAALLLHPAAAAADGPPVITIISPLERAVARPYLHVVATCAADDPSGCVSMTVSECAGTVSSTNSPITVAGSLVDVFVQPCSYFDDWLGMLGNTVTFVEVSGVDAAGRRTSRRVVNITRETSPTLRVVTTVDGRIQDVRDGRIAYIRNYNSGDWNELQPTAPQELWIRDFQTPGADEHVPTPLGFTPGFLTPHGVMFYAYVSGPTSGYRVFEWRDHALLDLGPGVPSHKDGYAAWVSDEARRHLVIRNLVTGVNQEATLDMDVIAPIVDQTGAVLFRSAVNFPNQLFRYRAGAVTQLTFDENADHYAAAIDGDHVAYTRHDAAGYATVLLDGTHASVLSANGAYATLEGGWVVYNKGVAPRDYPEVFLRDPSGSESQLTSAGYTYQLALAPDGETAVRISNFTHRELGGIFLVRRGGAPRRLMNEGMVPYPVSTNGRWYIAIGNTLFEPVDGCGLNVTSSAGRYGAPGGSGSLAIEGPDGCAWSAIGGPPWITISAGARGTGTGAVLFNVAPNAGKGRTATIEIAGQTVTIRQDAGNASRPVRNDFTGGGRAVRAVYRPGGAQWWVEGNTPPMVTWGQPAWIPVPEDYNGDGQIDLAAFAPETGTWWLRGSMNVVWGVAGDVPVPADYDGDGRADVAVFRPGTGQWLVKDQLTAQWGLPGDIPVPADYDGDGRADVAVFRPSTGMWYVRGGVSAQWGLPGDIPVPADYDGDGSIDIAVFRPATGTWLVRGLFTRQYGAVGDLPVPLDFDGDGRAELAVYRRSSGTWFVENSGPGVDYGRPGDLPLGFPAALLPRLALDQGGDHRTDAAFYREASGQWIVQQSTMNFTTRDLFSFGLASDVRRIADVDGDGRGDLVIMRPSTGMWYVDLSATSFQQYATYGPWGATGDAVLPGDYDGDRKADLAVFRPSSGRWYIKTSSSGFVDSVMIDWGLPGDVAAPADYDGDGRADVAVFRPSLGRWYVKRSSDGSTLVVDWGLASDVPVAADYDGDGRADVAIFRPSTGEWWIRYSSTDFATYATVVYGAAGDTPMPGDYNGDGFAEPAYFRPDVGFFVYSLGQIDSAVSGDQPIRDR